MGIVFQIQQRERVGHPLPSGESLYLKVADKPSAKVVRWLKGIQETIVVISMPD